METHVKVVGVLNIVFGVLGLCSAAVLMLILCEGWPGEQRPTGKDDHEGKQLFHAGWSHVEGHGFLGGSRSLRTGNFACPTPKFPLAGSAATTRSVMPSGASLRTGTKNGASKLARSPL